MIVLLSIVLFLVVLIEDGDPTDVGTSTEPVATDGDFGFFRNNRNPLLLFFELESSLVEGEVGSLMR